MRNARWLAGAGVLLLGVGLAVQGRLEAAALTPALAWYRTHNGPAAGSDQASALAVGPDGSLYVTGYSSNGSNHDYLTIRHGADGSVAPGWPQRFNGSADSTDVPTAIAVDADGSVYVVGRTWNGGNFDYMTVKYDSGGNLVPGWPQVYGASANSSESAVAVAADGLGNIYIAGQSHDGSNHDYLTVKYDPEGNMASGWPKRYNSSSNKDDIPVALAVADDGVYVTGESVGGSSWDYLTVKYDAGGNVVTGWPQRYNGSANSSDGVKALTVVDGFVYVTGSSSNGRDFDCLTVKYAADGETVTGWPQRYDSGQINGDVPQAICADAMGNTYIIGSSYSGSNMDCLALRYTPDGTLSWSDLWENPAAGGQDDRAWLLDMDARGQVYVAGDTATHATGFLLLKYAVQYTPEAQSFNVTTDESAPAAAKLLATDIDSTSLTYTVVDAPDHGSLSGTAPDLTYTPDDGYYGADSFTYKASDGTHESNTATVSITVDPVGLPASLVLSPGTSAKGGDSLTGKVTLDAAAVGSGAVVDLAASDPAASVPASVTVPAGQTEAAFTVTTSGVAADTPVTLTASRAGVEKTAELTVEAAALRALTLTPGRVVGSRDVRGRVFLDADAPAAGLTVSLATAHAAASVPADVTVASGGRWADFTVTTSSVTADTTADVEATWDGVTRKRALTVAPLLAGVTVTTPDRVGGSPRYAVVTLNGPAPTGGALVDLSSSDPALAPPAQVRVAAGRWSLRFLLASAPVAADTEVTLTASHAGRDVTGTGKVLAPGLLRLRGRTSSVGGRTVPLYVDLTGPAPAGGLTVSLSSDDAAASVPAQVTVPAGAAAAMVPVRLSRVSSSRTATVTATLGGVSKALAITITP